MKLIADTEKSSGYQWNEQHFISVFDAIASGIIVLSSDGVIQQINRAASEVLGLNKQAATGKSYEELSFMALDESGSPLDFSQYPSQITFRTGRPVKDRVIGMVLSKKMEYNWYVISTNPVNVINGIPHQVVITLTPITGKGEIEEALRQSEERFRSLVTSMEDTVFTLDKELVHTGIYGKWMNKHNMTPDDFIGKSVSEIFGDLAEGHESACQNVLSSGASSCFEWKRFRDGKIFYYQAWLSPLKRSDGDVYGIVGVSRDITLQKETEVDLLESEERFRQFAENANDVFWMRDSKTGDYLYLSPAFSKVWGFEAHEFYDNRKSLDSTVHSEDYKIVTDSFRNIPQTDYEMEYRIVRPDGEIRWIRSKAFPIFNKHGELFRIAGIAEDITDLKDKEELMRKSDKLAIVGELAAGVAHEIRNPLTSIKGFVQLVKPEIREHVSKILLSELDRIESIVNEFLVLAKPHSDTLFKSNNLNEFIKQTISLLDSEAHLNNVQFQLELFDHLPLVESESHQVKQVLINVLKNAMEAMPVGGTIKVKTSVKDDQYISITIEDQGVGISEDRINRLGEPFYSNKEKGIGLGLMVSLKIIENHKGMITFNSTLFQGTTVIISLPYIT